jgi:hypothetical protein
LSKVCINCFLLQLLARQAIEGKRVRSILPQSRKKRRGLQVF